MMMFESVLRSMTVDGVLYEKQKGKTLRCLACGHLCIIEDGKEGICKFRRNQGGVLKVPHGYVSGLACDPIEKKPFFHAMPGTDALSFGMLGCNLRCPFCQNWSTSQTLRDACASSSPPRRITAAEIVDAAKREGASTIASTYNEPLITSEWSAEIFALAHAAGLKTAYVSNGHGSPEVLQYMRPHLDMMKIDLKCFSEKGYQQLGGKLQAVLTTIESAYRLGLWVEVVTLIVPYFNESDGELRNIAHFIVDISPDIPWHVTAFHADYKMTDRPNTSGRDLLRAVNIAKEEGLRYVYAGNRPGQVKDAENTVCPSCSAVVIERSGFEVRENRLAGGSCPDCQTKIPGVWA